MRTNTKKGLGGTALCLAGVLPAFVLAAPAAALAPATGDLTVTVFNDGYPDAAYDPALESPSGSRDQVRDVGYVHVQAADGSWYTTGADADGRYTFENIPLGAASVYTTDPNVYRSVSYFQVTSEGPALAEPTTYSFQDGTFQFTNSDEVITTYDSSSDLASVSEATVTADSELVIGQTSVSASAQVLSAGGAPLTEHAEVEFLSVGHRISAMEPTEEGVYYTEGLQRLVPADLGISVDPIPGFAIESVTATSYNSGEPLAVTQRDGGWYVDTTGLTSALDRAVFTVQLEELPTADVVITQFEDRVLDGVFNPEIEGPTGETDQRRESGYVYIQDAYGDWWGAVSDENGDYTFPNIPAGEATVYLSAPNSYPSSTWWDATDIADYTEIERGGYANVDFEEGLYVTPDGERRPLRGSGVLAGTVQVDLAEGDSPQSIEIGMAAVTQDATVVTADGETVTDAELTFTSNEEVLTAQPVDGEPGTYYAADAEGMAYLSAANYGLAVDAPEGWEVVEVTAVSSVVPELEYIVAEGESGWFVASPQVASYFDSVEWNVVLDEVEVVTPPGDGDDNGDGGTDGNGAGDDNGDDNGEGSAPAGDDDRDELADTGASIGGLALGAALLLALGVAFRRLKRA